MSKRLIAFIALFILAQVSFAAWDGSVKIPKTVVSDGVEYYEITSPEELIGLLDSVLVIRSFDESLQAYLKNDIVFGEDSTKLCSKKWIRNENQTYFQGVLDGRGYTIYGLNAASSMFKTIGINVGEVRNINVANSSFGSDSAYQVGVVADMMRGVVQNVKVYNTKVVSGYDAGGIAASMVSSDDELTGILNCHVVGGSVKGSSYVGGIVGSARGRILGCSNSARVSFSEKETERTNYTSDVFVGGIAGYAVSQPGYAIESCVNRGPVEVISAHMESYVGGVAGQVLGSVSNLQNYGDVTAKLSYFSDTASSQWQMISYVGGIVGSKHLHQYETGELRDFLNEGNVAAFVQSSLESGSLCVGGIFGENRSNTITNALNRGSVKAYGYGGLMTTYVGGVIGYEPMNSYYLGFDKLGNRGEVYAEGVYRTYVGGVLGHANRPYAKNPALYRSYNYGNVTGSVADTASLSDQLDVGGLVGYANEMLISDVYNHGRVLSKGKLANGTSYVGGIVGRFSYPDFYIQNSYSAAPSVKGDVVGGLIGYTNAMVSPRNAYYDGSLSSVDPLGEVLYSDMVECTGCKKTTSELQSEKTVALLNTSNGESLDRKLWTRREGYPVFTFDNLYKNDSIYFEYDEFAMPPLHAKGDTLVYTISTAAELRNFLEMGGNYDKYKKKLKVELANDIVMGEDTTHLSMRKIAADTNRTTGLNMHFSGNGHTIYGLNMSRAMFFYVGPEGLVENMTIANSRFENNYGKSAAGVAIELSDGACIRNVTIRNSVVKGGEAAGGIVVDNYGVVRNNVNENTLVESYNISGGIVANNYNVTVENANSGRVSGRLVGGIIGSSYWYGNSTVTITDNSNRGMVLASGEGPVFAGGIVGYALRASVTRNFNAGLVEGRTALGTLTVGGVVGRLDTANVFANNGNWGRVHVLSGKEVYAGGLVGRSKGSLERSSLSPGTYYNSAILSASFNYGPVSVKSSDSVAYAGGLLGYNYGSAVYTSYNRGSVINEGKSTRKYTGGIASVVEGGRISGGYNYSDSLSGDGVASLVYEFVGSWNYLDKYYYGGSTVPAVVKYSSDSSNTYKKDSLVFKTFDEMQGTLDFLTESDWKFGDCLPKIAYDTTSTCVSTGIADSYGDSDKPYEVSFLESLVYVSSDTSSHDGPTPVVPAVVKVVAPTMHVEVTAHNVMVTDLAENAPVMVFDMRGRLVTSARAHGTSVNLSIPKSGRFLVRSGKQSRLIVVR